MTVLACLNYCNNKQFEGDKAAPGHPDLRGMRHILYLDVADRPCRIGCAISGGQIDYYYNNSGYGEKIA